MMRDQPNNPEYCQGIYEAAKKVVEHLEWSRKYFALNDEGLVTHINNLKRTLEGKP